MDHTVLTHRGMELLVSHLVGGSTTAHAAWLAEQLQLQHAAVVADMGCGIGALADAMLTARPDIRFILVNRDPLQAAECRGDVRVESFERTSIAAGSCDAVVFHFAFVHADPTAAMAEAKRVLRPGGRLALFEPFGDVPGWSDLLPGSVLHAREDVVATARAAGFALVKVLEPAADAGLCRQVLAEIGEAHIFDATFAKITPTLLVFERMADWNLEVYAKPALHFSGGKDSLACLLLLRDAGQLDRVTVYWLNAGDGCPETLDIVEWARTWVPHFVEVRSDARAWRARHGDPSDLVPASAHVLGVAYGMGTRQLVGRFDCCWFNLMAPMHERMVADGVDAVIRGTKLADTGRVPAEGRTADYDVVLPLRGWSHQQVFDYLACAGAPVNPVYDHAAGASAPECLTCTAWWDDGKAAFLAARHPSRVPEYRASLAHVRAALRAHLDDLNRELEVCDGRMG